MEKQTATCISIHNYQPKIKSVFINHLHTVYHNKREIAGFLMHIEGKANQTSLKQLISNYRLVIAKHLDEINTLYSFLNIQAEEAFVTGFKTYSTEALIAILKQNKDPFKTELTLLNHLQSISAIDSNNAELLYWMSASLNLTKFNMMGMVVSSKFILKELQGITQRLIGSL